MRVTDLADDDFVADTGLGQFLDVSQPERLSLFDALPSHRRLCLNACSLLLIDGIADDASRESPDRGPDQRAGTWVMGRRADDRARAGANGPAFQRTRRGIVWTTLRCVTPRQNNPGRQD